MANVTFNLEANEAQAVQAFLRVVDAQKKTEEGFKNVWRAGKDNSNLFKDMGGDLVRMAAGYASVAAAIETARKALEFYNRERERGAERLKSGEASGSRLLQLASNQGDMRRMLAESEKTSVQAGISPEAARRLQFELESSGNAGQRGLFASLAGIVEDPAQMVHAVTTARNAFGGRAASVRKTLNMAKMAAGPETIDFGEVMTESATIAPGIAQLGGTPAEAMAVLSMLSSARKNPEQAATEIKALSKVMMNKGVGGGGFLSGLQSLQGKVAGKSDRSLVKFFEDQEAFRGYATLSPLLGELQSRAAMFSGAREGEGDEMAKMFALREQIPELSMARAARAGGQAVASREASTYGLGKLGAETARQGVMEASIAAGESPVRRFLRDTAAGIAETFGGGEDAVFRAAGLMSGAQKTSTIDINAAFDINSAAKIFERSARAMAAAARQNRNAGVVE